jgi:hypothetical protein
MTTSASSLARTLRLLGSYFFASLKDIGALLTCCSPLTTQVRNEVDGDIVLQDLDDLEVTSQINKILKRERDGAKESSKLVVSDINVPRLSEGD